MTTTNQNIDESIAVSEGTTQSQGVNNNGNEEPTGQYPKSDYFYSTNLNYAATGAARNELYTGGGDLGLALGLNEQGASEYPYNQVSETTSGHIIEIDDTPGNERILIKHRTGSGVELRSDGTVLAASTKNKVELVADDHTVVVEGEGNLVYKGNLNLKVTGDFNIECTNFNVKSNGAYNMTVAQSHRTKIGGNLGETVGGGSSRTTVGQVTNTSLAGFSNNVKGIYSNNVDGDVNHFSSGTTTMTSEIQMNLTSEVVNLIGTKLSAIGSKGTIGGFGVHIKGSEGDFEGSVAAPTFYGNLIGKAKFAALADKALGANTSGTAGGLGGGGTGSASYPSDPGEPSFVQPAPDAVTAYLTQSEIGIREVSIDDGDFIKQSIDKTEVYGGLSNLDLNTGLVRSRLRDLSNLSVDDFVSKAVAEGVLSPNYGKIAPPGVGRVASGGTTPKFGQQQFGNVKITSASDPFLPRKLTANLIPDPLYNPDFLSTITSATKLAPGVSIAKFLGSIDHPTPLSFIKDEQQKRDLARQLYLHAEVMRTISTNKANFSDYRLIVKEGVYRPGPQETPKGLNALKLFGLAVVYDLVDNKGVSDLPVLFDLAEYWKDTLYFDKMILSYDTYDPSKELDGQIVLIMPQIDEDWTGVFNREVETHFNGRKMANGELVECTTSSTLPTTTTVEPLPGQGGKFGVTKSAILKPILYTLNGTSDLVQPGALENMQSLLSNEYAALQDEFGGPLTINDGLAKFDTSRESNTPSSQHFYGRAIDIDISNYSSPLRSKLLEAAIKVGFKGFGLGNTILHLDVRPVSKRNGQAGKRDAWNYGNAMWAGKSFKGYWEPLIEN